MQYRFTEGAGVDPAEKARMIDAGTLQAFTAKVFEGLGMPACDGGGGVGVGQPSRHRLPRGAAGGSLQ